MSTAAPIDPKISQVSRAQQERMQKNLKIVWGLYDFAYEMKRHQLKRKHPTWTDDQLHEKTIELIRAGCR